jgi:hypothetical protein
MATAHFSSLAPNPQLSEQCMNGEEYMDSILRPLSPEAQKAAGEAYGRPLSQAKVSLKTSDLITMAINSRRMLREANKLWRISPRNDGSDLANYMAWEYADVSESGKTLTPYIIGALIERVGVKLFGFDAQLYSGFAAWLYYEHLHRLDAFVETAFRVQARTLTTAAAQAA